MRARWLRATLGLALSCPPALVHAAPSNDGPTRIVPQKKNGKTRRTERREQTDRSEGGTRRGVLELSLGSVVLASSGLLIGRGTWEIVTSRRFARRCETGESSAVSCQLLNPRRNGQVAAGLTFSVAALLGVAGGFLLARGLRINRDYRAFQRREQGQPGSSTALRWRVSPWASVAQRSGGMSLHLSF